MDRRPQAGSGLGRALLSVSEAFSFPQLGLQLKASTGRISRLVLQSFHARDGNIAANLPKIDQLTGRVPVVFRLTDDPRAGGLLQPGANFHAAPACIHKLGLITFGGVVLASL